MSTKIGCDRRGSVALLAAVVFPVVIGMAGLAVEYGSALLIKLQMQRVADLAAYGGAVAYQSTASSSSLNAAVARIATLNGIASSSATPSIVNSPSGDGNQAVLVTVSGSISLGLSRVLGTASQVSVASSAYAEIKSTGAACVIALGGPGTAWTGITLSGGTTLSAPNCVLESNSTVYVPNGTSITTSAVNYDFPTAPTANTISNIVPPAGQASVTYTKKLSSDPLSGNTAVAAATTHLAAVAQIAAPAAPSPASASDITFGYYPTSLSQAGCTAALSGNTWTVTCTGSGPFNFGNLSSSGGLTVNFNTSGSASATYNFSGNVDGSNGSAINFGPGTYNIKGGIIVGGGMSASFGAGTFNIGTLSSACNSTSGYSICNSGSALSIAGPSTFVLAGGIYDAGGSILTLGSSAAGNTTPTTNSFNIGQAADGNSLLVGGGGITTLADATGASDYFRIIGNIVTGGGSCLVLSSASNHDVKGSLSAAGGVYLGAGTYSIIGYVALGAAGGGNVTCVINSASQSLGLSGSGVTFVIGATTTPGNGNCSGMAFCVGAGYSTVTLTAPGSGTLAGLVVVGPTTSSNSTGAYFGEGATNTSLSGVFYLPYGPITLSGGARVGGGTGQCLEFIGLEISLTGGTALASTCTGLGGSSASTVVLVQ